MKLKFKLFTHKEGIYNPHLRKLNSKATIGSFIGYTVNSKGFLCFSILHIILELLIVKFLENVEPSGSIYPQRFYLEKTEELTEGLLYEGCLIVLMKNQIDYPEQQSVLELSTHEEQVQHESTQTLPNAKEVEWGKDTLPS
jgi:hypothetical protein